MSVGRTTSSPLLRGGAVRLMAVLIAVLLTATTSSSVMGQPRPNPRARPNARPADEGAAPVAEPEVAPDEPPAADERTYTELKVDEAARKNESTVNQTLTKGKFEGDEKERFDQFFKEYFLPQWTQKKGVTNLLKHRGKLRSYLGKKSIGGSAVQDHLNELVLEYMNGLAEGDYHPAVRINAMLTIGDLNRTGSDSGTPLPDALPVLITAAENAKLPMAVRAAAMVGVLRHASSGTLDDEARRSLTLAMTRLATGKVSEGVAAQGEAWLRMQAIETLGILGSVGEENGVFKAMAKTVADEKLPSFLRCTAAGSLGQLNYSSAGGINATETAAALVRYASRACEDELQAATKAADAWQASKKPDDPNAMNKPANFVSCRRLAQRLDAVLFALEGKPNDANRKGIVSLIRDQNQRTSLEGLGKAIQGAIEALDVKDDSKDMKPVVVELEKTLKAWQGKNGG